MSQLREPAFDRIVALVEDHMRFGDVTRMRESTLKRFLRADIRPSNKLRL